MRLVWVRCAILLVAASGVGASVAAAQQAKLINPFPPAPSAPAVATTSNPDLDALEFSGVSSILDQRSFNFTDSRSRKSFWVPLDGEANGFAVVSYDEQAERVVVRHGTFTRAIELRKPKLLVAPAAPVRRPDYGAPVATATVANARPPGAGVDEIRNPKTPEEIKQAEYEARMLVSDLLDISMQERARQKALRDAQAGNAGAPKPANAAVAGTRR